MHEVGKRTTVVKLVNDMKSEEEEPIDIKAVMAEIKELEAKRAELDKEIEVYLKELRGRTRIALGYTVGSKSNNKTQK